MMEKLEKKLSCLLHMLVGNTGYIAHVYCIKKWFTEYNLKVYSIHQVLNPVQCVYLWYS